MARRRRPTADGRPLRYWARGVAREEIDADKLAAALIRIAALRASGDEQRAAGQSRVLLRGVSGGR